MGQEIKISSFTNRDRNEFYVRLKQETKLLEQRFDAQQIENPQKFTFGLEVEAWLIDKHQNPFAGNERFIKMALDPLVVHEISKYNFELNAVPLALENSCFSVMLAQLKKTWEHCYKTSKRMGLNPLLIGVLPTLKDEMLSINTMTQSNRYKALNEQLFFLRKYKPIRCYIESEEESLELIKRDIMLEAATTSIQIHLKMGPGDFWKYYNASLIASAPLVAMSANSPFLYGQQLWDETRITIFEQIVQGGGFRNHNGEKIERVTFGSGCAKKSVMELFLENLNHYPILIPTLFDDPPEALSHLKFHNGTIWRWNRPIIGLGKDNSTHLRIEHRVMPAGPSLVDIVSNTAFYIGLIYYLANQKKFLEPFFHFNVAKENFYNCAKKGLSAKVNWLGKSTSVKALIEQALIPHIVASLIELGIDKEESKFYIEEIIGQRVQKELNGANWQKRFVKKYGKDFKALTENYLSLQKNGDPVHTWKI